MHMPPRRLLFLPHQLGSMLLSALALLHRAENHKPRRDSGVPISDLPPLYMETNERLAKAVWEKESIRSEDQRLNQTRRHIGQLNRMGCSIAACLNADDILHATCRNIRQLMDVDVFAAGFQQPGCDHIEFSFGLTGDRRNARFCLGMDDQSHPAVQCLLRQQEILVHHPVPAAARTAQPADAASLPSGATASGSSLYVPLSLSNGARGVMCLHSEHPQAYRRLDTAAALALSSYAVVALDNAHAYAALQREQQRLAAENRRLEDAYRSLEEVSLTDPLTGLRNRRFLQQHLDADAAIAVRHYEDWNRAGRMPDSPDIDMVFFLVDIDHFKAVNDQYGHDAGDKVLVQMRERLEKVFRESDYLIRWGGEEFLVVARASSRMEAARLAERIRHTVADTPFSIDDGICLTKTCSIGFAPFPLIPARPGFMPWQQTVQLADQGLYMAKRAGRDTWYGLLENGATAQAGNPERLIHQTADAIQAGELRAVTRDAGLAPHLQA